MAVRKKGKYRYGDSMKDLRAEMTRYSREEYPIDHFAEPHCSCGGQRFHLLLDEEEGVAIRRCAACGIEHPMGDSDQFLADAHPEQRACVCGHSELELAVGVALYEGSADVKWVYIGCRCPTCGVIGVYGDWKNEFEGYQKFLSQI